MATLVWCTVMFSCCLSASSVLALVTFPTYRQDTLWPANPAHLSGPFSAMGIDEHGTVYTAQRGVSSFQPIVVMNQTGQVITSWGSKVISSPHGMHIQKHPDMQSIVWVTDVGPGATGHTVKAFTPDGSLLLCIGTPGTAGSSLDPVQFDNVADVSFATLSSVGSSSRTLVVISDGDGGFNDRVLGFVMSTTPLKLSLNFVIGGNGTQPGKFQSPHSVELFQYDNFLYIMVADRGNSRVQVFSETGELIGIWTDCTAAGGAPWGLRVDADRGVLFVADGTLDEVHVVDLLASLNVLGERAPGTKQPFTLGACVVKQTLTGGVTPHELAVDPRNGDVYLANVGSPSTIQRFVIVTDAGIS